MLCQNCGKNHAIAFYKENINGQVKELALCSECASKSNMTNFDLLSGFWNDDFIKNPFFSLPLSKQAIAGGRICPKCSMTESELRRTGRVGCGECYKNFSDILLPYIKKLQGSSAHVGTNAKSEQNPIDELKKRLNDAVKVENYEEAAKLRDEIRRKESEQNG